jgi:hypothetical protein
MSTYKILKGYIFYYFSLALKKYSLPQYWQLIRLSTRYMHLIQNDYTLHIRKNKTGQVLRTTIACLALFAYLVYLVYPVSTSKVGSPQFRGWIIFAITIIIFCVALYLIVQDIKDCNIKSIAAPNHFVFNDKIDVLRHDLVLYLSKTSTQFGSYKYHIKVLDLSKGLTITIATRLSHKLAQRVLVALENFMQVRHRVEQDFWESF